MPQRQRETLFFLAFLRLAALIAVWLSPVWLSLVWLSLVWLSIGGVQSAYAAPAADYWMYVGTYTSRGAQGIYLFKFHAATGKLEPAGLAAGRLWQANSDSFTEGIPRMWSQFRAEWPNPRLIVRGVQNPLFLAIDPGQRYLYTADDIIPGSAVSAFRINPESGKLTLLNERPSAGDGPCFVTVDRAGKNLLVANFTGGGIAVFPIGGDGYLRDVSSIIRHKGLGSDQKLQPHPHSITLSPDNRFAIATDLGLDQVLIYHFIADKGTLSPNDPPFIKTPSGSGARHFAFHPGGKYAYVIEEAGSSIMTMQWDALHGVLTPIGNVSTLPPDFRGNNATAEILVHPNGRFLYGSNRGHDSIAVFAIDPNKGTLTPIEQVSSRGSRPRSFSIDPTGHYLFAANVESQNMVQFRIDQQTGRLSPTGSAFQIPYPAAIRFAAAR